MDLNLAFACVGYGSVRALRSREFSTKPYALAASWILKEPDPVQYCIDAMGIEHPDWAKKVDSETRLAIRKRLETEARRENGARISSASLRNSGRGA